jgi:hypothetical protein
VKTRLATSIWLCVLAGLGVCAVGQEGPDAELEAQARERSLDYELHLHHGATYVDVELGGASGLFLLDTGANTSGVDAGWLESTRAGYTPGPPSVLGGTTGNLAVESARFERVFLGRGYFASATLKVQDFSGFSAPAGRQQAGLLGTDLLGAYQVTIDYVSQRAWLRLAHEREPLSPALQATTLTHPLHLPTVNVRVAGLDMPCRLDSGASYLGQGPYLDINQAALRALQRARVPLEAAGSLRVRGVGGSSRLALYRGPAGTPLTLEMGPVVLQDVTLVVHGQGTLAVSQPLALASASVLQRCEVVVLDPFDDLLWLPASPRQGPY